ncbi:MAG TPA: O-antigen ligase family protein, partial [Tepidisphaeraceae bacterium]|nr:O-antigen ligase family protein [Tepidisphaeraceae bacterium]
MDESNQSRSSTLTRIAFGMALAIVGVRATILEAPRELLNGAGAPASPLAGTSLTLDLLSCLPALLVVIRRLIDPEFRIKKSPVHLIWMMLAFFALISTSWASDRYLTLVTAPQLISIGALSWTIMQCVQRWEHLRVVAAFAFGLLVVNAAQGIMWREIDWKNTLEMFHQHQDTVLRERGFEPGSFAAQRFVAKLEAGEILGFAASPNTFGSIVVMLSIVCVGVIAQRIANKDESGWAGAPVIGLALSIYLLNHVHSKAAWAALLLGILCIGVWIAMRSWLARKHRIVFICCALMVVLGSLGVLAYGLMERGLPDASLNFRWRYWTGALGIFLERPLAGIGWSNFADAYLAHRTPPAAEEIRDPHNYLIRLACELGTIGALLGLIWTGLVAWRMTRPRATEIVVIDRTRAFPIWKILWLAPALVIGNILAGLDLSADIYYVITEVIERGLFGLVMAIGIAAVCLRSTASSTIDTRPAPFLLAAMIIAVGVWMLQSLIDLAFFETGSLVIGMMLASAALGIRTREPTAARRRVLIAAAIALASVMWFAMLVVVVIPAITGERYARQANEIGLSQRPRDAARLYAKAFHSLPVGDYDYALRASQYFAADQSEVESALEWADLAVRSNPRSTAAALNRARLNWHRTPS